MTKVVFSRFAAIVLLGGFAASAGAADRKAEDILKEIEGLQPPRITQAEVKDRAKVNEYMTKMREVAGKRAELAGELYKVDPKHPRLAGLLPARWQYIIQMGGDEKAALKEVEDIIANSKDETLVTAAQFQKVVNVLVKNRENAEVALPAVEEFLKKYPKDARGSQLLVSIAMSIEDSEKQATLYRRIAKDYAGSAAAKRVEGSLRQLDSVGKPFDLEFKEAITGSQISVKGLKGKVVVVDFWATWCGPCIAEMPKMKKLYADFKDKGVEFIGVSLDQPKEQGGYDKLKKYVEENKIEWPQYYQGNFWQSEFSSSWGINSIPAVFVVDQDGKLFSVNARGKLDKMIPELLAKAKK